MTLAVTAPKKQFGSFDDLDNRRTLWRLLERVGRGLTSDLACQRRRKILEWACSVCPKDRTQIPAMVTPQFIGQVSETYLSLCALATVYGLDLTRVVLRIERALR